MLSLPQKGSTLLIELDRKLWCVKYCLLTNLPHPRPYLDMIRTCRSVIASRLACMCVEFRQQDFGTRTGKVQAAHDTSSNLQ